MEPKEGNGLDARIIDAEVISKEIGPVIDNALSEASKIAANIIDAPSRNRAVDLGVQVKDVIGKAEAWRDAYYIPVYRAGENLRGFVDPKIKQGKAILKLLSSGVSEFDIKERRKAELERERREAEARRIQQEAEQKKREAEEAERKAKQAEEDEARRKKEAQEAEERRIKAEKEAEERRQAEARRMEQEERDRKLKEEEEARLLQAQQAQDVGSGHKVDNILDRQTPISRVIASPQVAGDAQTLQIEQELAAKTAREKAETERKASEEAAQRQEAARLEAEKKRREAAQAQADADAAAASASAAANVVAMRPDERTRSVVKWRWDLIGATPEDSLKSFLALAKAVIEGRAPVEYLGYDPKAPEKFRPTTINKDVQALKGQFACDGLRAFPQEDTHFKATAIGGAL